MRAPFGVRTAIAIAGALLVAMSLTGAQRSMAQHTLKLEGACYCRIQGRLECFGVLAEPDCARRCVEEFCDDWFWLERRPCWNWGYGG